MVPRSGADGDLRPHVARLVSRTEGAAEYVDIVERTGMAGYGRTRGT
jgi:hypothetical protein